MASGKKGAKGNKTAHVLNLLTAPGEAAPAAEETAGEASAPAAQTAAGRPLLPPILEVAQANDNDLAQQIQQALEEELSPPAEEAAPVEEVIPVAETKPASGGKMSQDEIEAMLAAMNAVEESAPAPEPEPAPAPQPAPAPAAPAVPAAPAASGGKMSQDEIEAMLAAMNAGGEPAPAPESASAPQPAPKEEKKPEPPEEEEDVSYVNVMQTLVEEIAPRYIKKFGLCTCNHCAADVKALALNNLVPKYVVLSKMDRIPMLTVYEGRFNTTIFAQLTRACKVVMDHPHHNRPE